MHLEVRKSEINAEFRRIIVDQLLDITKSDRLLTTRSDRLGAAKPERCKTCDWTAQSALSHMKGLLQETLSDNGDGRHFSLSEKVYTFKTMSIPSSPSKGCCHRLHDGSNYQANRVQELEEFEKGSGVCLDCFKRKEKSGKILDFCRVRHS